MRVRITCAARALSLTLILPLFHVVTPFITGKIPATNLNVRLVAETFNKNYQINLHLPNAGG